MGVLIPGMKMPKAGDCFIVFPDGDVWSGGKRIGKVGTAVELPSHGRLGDLDALELRYEESADGWKHAPVFMDFLKACAKDVREMPTIIPADPEGGADR